MKNQITKSESVRGEKAYVWALKHRALRHHALGYGTWSIDVGNLEKLRKAYSKEIKPITYVPIFVKATALAVKRNPEANALLFRSLFGRKIVHFDKIDVNLPIIRTVGSEELTFIGTIRNAAEKSLAEIQAELTEYQRCAPEDSFSIQRLKRFAGKPLWFARLIHWWLTWSPKFYIENVGTTALTFAPQPARSSHAFVEGNWYEHFFPTGPATTCFCIGSIKNEPVAQGQEVVVRRLLRCTGMMDNYVLNGFTAAQLAADFKDLLESGAFIRAELDEQS